MVNYYSCFSLNLVWAHEVCNGFSRFYVFSLCFRAPHSTFCHFLFNFFWSRFKGKRRLFAKLVRVILTGRVYEFDKMLQTTIAMTIMLVAMCAHSAGMRDK